MQVEMSLAEMLINAIAQGKVPGVQFKRGWSNDKATFDGLKVVIGSRLDVARSVAVQEALHKLHDEHPGFRTRARVKALEESLAFTIDVIEHEVPAKTCTCSACSDCSGAFYLAENMREVRAVLSNSEDPKRSPVCVVCGNDV